MASNHLRSKWRNARLLFVRLDGTGTAAITGPDADLFTLTDNGTGDYTLTATTAFAEPPFVSGTMITADAALSQVAPTTTVINVKTRQIDDAPAAMDADVDLIIYAPQLFSVDNGV